MEIKEYKAGLNKLFVEHLIPDKVEDKDEEDDDITEHPIVFVHGVFSGHGKVE